MFVITFFAGDSNVSSLFCFVLIANLNLNWNCLKELKMHTVFPHIVSAETILFWIWKSKGHSTYGQRSQYIEARKLFKGGNYSRAETIWGNTVVYFEPPTRFCPYVRLKIHFIWSSTCTFCWLSIPNFELQYSLI